MMMSTPNKKSTAGFISFSAAAAAVKDPDGVRSGAAGYEPFYSGEDGELRALFKRLTKKDVTTKLRCFAEVRVPIFSVLKADSSV